MLFTITGKHIDVTEAVKKYAEKKTSKLPRFYDSINQVEVIINGSKAGLIKVEIIARAEHNKVFVVAETGHLDAYASLDAAVHKLETQLRRKKGKERDNKYAAGGEKTKP